MVSIFEIGISQNPNVTIWSVFQNHVTILLLLVAWNKHGVYHVNVHYTMIIIINAMIYDNKVTVDNSHVITDSICITHS